MLPQTRANANDANWWRQQLGAAEDELGQAEWALALWSIASGEVISDLLAVWERVIDDLPAPRRRTVLRAAEQVAQFGWLTSRPVSSNKADVELAALISKRAPASSETKREADSQVQPDRVAPSSLLNVARSGQWLKVDSQPVYR